MLYKKGKGKTIPVKAYYRCSGFQDSIQSAHEGGKVVSPTHRPRLPPWNESWHALLLQPESIPGP